jgi:hypothetical protein
MKYPFLIGAIAALLNLQLAFAADGTAVGVNPDAHAIAIATERVLQVGADVSMGELIRTGSQGQVQMVFGDNTRLVVGANSSLLIEQYLLGDGDTAQAFAINALGGTFRFMTGNSPKAAYSVRTPTASIAVRGTAFDLVVDMERTHVMLYQGALEICSTDKHCVVLDERCEIGVTAARAAKLFASGTPERLDQSFGFRYARFQRALLPAFRIDGAARCAEAGMNSQPSRAPNGSSTSQAQFPPLPGQPEPPPDFWSGLTSALRSTRFSCLTQGVWVRRLSVSRMPYSLNQAV